MRRSEERRHQDDGNARWPCSLNWRTGAKPLRSTLPVLYSTTTRGLPCRALHRGTLAPSVGCLRSSLVGRPPISSLFSIRYVNPPCAFRLPCRCVDVGGNPGGMEGPTVEGTEESPDRCRARGQNGPRRANGECCFYFPCTRKVPTFECRNK